MHSTVALAILCLTLAVFSCAPYEPFVKVTNAPDHLASTARSGTIPPGATYTAQPYKIPPLDADWQVQYSGELDMEVDVDIFNLDLFDTGAVIFAVLHQRATFVICYFSAGSYEDWRPDSQIFPDQVLGKSMARWPGERWLDIRRIELLEPVINARMDLASEKGCDGVDPDNMNGYTNDSGFPLTFDDQLTYNIWLSEMAHAHGLSIGLKNDFEQTAQLEPYFDWALSEQCFYYNECDSLLPFIEHAKPVFNVEYELDPQQFCSRSKQLGIRSIRKHINLDAFIESCN